MSLYRHVRDKDELLLTDDGLGDRRVPACPRRSRPGGGRGARDRGPQPVADFRRHPWLAAALSLTRPAVLPPGALAYSEWVLGVLSAAGMDALTTFTTHLTVFTFVRGTAVNLELEADAEAASGQTSDEWMAEQEPMLEALVADGRSPALRPGPRQTEFDLDLDAAVRVRPAAPPRRHRGYRRAADPALSRASAM